MSDTVAPGGAGAFAAIDDAKVSAIPVEDHVRLRHGLLHRRLRPVRHRHRRRPAEARSGTCRPARSPAELRHAARPPRSARSSSAASPTSSGRKNIYGYEVLILAIGRHRVRVRAELHVPARLPDRPGHRHRRRLPGFRDDHERVLGQAVPRAAWSGWSSPCRAPAWSSARWSPPILLASGHVATISSGASCSDSGPCPGLAVFYLRRQIHETPAVRHWRRGPLRRPKRAIAARDRNDTGRSPDARTESPARSPQSAPGGLHHDPGPHRRMLLWLIGDRRRLDAARLLLLRQHHLHARRS